MLIVTDLLDSVYVLANLLETWRIRLLQLRSKYLFNGILKNNHVV